MRSVSKRAAALLTTGVLIGGGTLAAVAFGANGTSTKQVPKSSTKTTTTKTTSASPTGSNEDATHEAGESAAREADEANGNFGGRHDGTFKPNEDAAHEKGESAAREAQEDAGKVPTVK
jgi:hypothetical protein